MMGVWFWLALGLMESGLLVLLYLTDPPKALYILFAACVYVLLLRAYEDIFHTPKLLAQIRANKQKALQKGQKNE